MENPSPAPPTQSLDSASARPSRARYIVLLWLCSAALIAYVQRNSLGVAESTMRAEFGVDKTTMGWAINAFALAYAIFQIPTGVAAHYLGSRRGLTVFSATWSVISGGVSLCFGWVGLALVRIGLGTAQAGLFPCVANTITHWFPKTKVGLPNGLLGSAMSVGGALGTALAGVLIGYIGWRWTYALFALPGIAWAIGFWLWFRDDPRDHPAVNAAELREIQSCRMTTEQLPDATQHVPFNKRAERIPWGVILASGSMWWIGAQQFFRAAGYMFFANWFPTFLQETRGVSVPNSGVYASLPLLAVVAGSFLGGLISDFVLRRTGSRWLARQGLSLAALTICGVLVAASYFIPSTPLAVMVISLGAFCASFSGPCAYAITIDLGGKHVTSVFSFMNMCGNVGGFAFPILVPYLQLWTTWNLVLFVFAGMYLAAAACWVCFDSRRPIVP